MGTPTKTILITGTGHCGTTFLSRVLMEAGCNFGQGDPPAPWTQGDQAMEEPFLQRSVYTLTKALWPDVGGLPDLTRLEAVAGENAEFVAEALNRWPPFFKSPALPLTLPVWIRAGLRVGAIIVCYRPLPHVLKSIMRRGGGFGGLGRFEDDTASLHRLAAIFGMKLDSILAAEIPFTLVRFPESVDPDRAAGVYELITRAFPLPVSQEAFVAAHARIADRGLVHV